MGEILIRQEEGQDSRRRTVSFSSETPYRRYFGMEILDHAEGAVDLGRLNSVGVLLFNHDVDRVVGRVVRAWVENNRGMAEVEFDTDADAEKIFSKVQSETLKTTSVRYRVDSWEEVRAGATSADGRFTGPCSIARRWTPMEISIVSIAAGKSPVKSPAKSGLRASSRSPPFFRKPGIGPFRPAAFGPSPPPGPPGAARSALPGRP